ncbi:MAG: aldo/keto reductase [Clostridia bacterium]|nr:aldo/keto reductase [Clostridia bacterium]
MLYKQIPDTNIKTSAIALGTNSIGSDIDEKTSFALLDTYVSLGGNHIDTAHYYGYGASEKTIGKWLSESGKRNDVIITTKGAWPYEGLPRLTKAEVEADLDESLSRLSLDYIDIYLLHRDCEDFAVEPIIDYFNEFVKKGKIRSFGCSNWSSKRARAANEYAKKSGQTGFAVSQIKWSLATVSPTYKEQDGLVPMTDDEYKFYLSANMAVMAYASQGKGFFAKMLSGGEAALSEKAKERYLCEENLKRLEKLKTLAAEKGVSASALLLSYLYSRPFTSVPVVGCSNVNQLKDSLSATDLVLTEDEINYLII